jgi:DnaJ family protein C protein 7
MPVKEVNDSNFSNELKTDKLIVIDFFATWCGPCKAIAPELEKLSSKYSQVANFIKVDVDKAKQTQSKYQITSMPTFILIRDEKRLTTVVGADIKKLESEIQKYAEKPAQPIASLGSAEEYKDAGNKAFSSRDWKTAIEYYSKAINLDANVPSYYSNRSACYLQLKKYKEALKDALKCTELDPKFVKGYFRAGTAMTCLGQLYEAKLQYEKAQTMEPHNTQIKEEKNKLEQIQKFVTTGQKYLESQQYREALQQFDRALDLTPMSTRIKLFKLEAMLALGDHDIVAKEAGHILRDEDPNSSEAYYLRGKALYYGGSVENGLKHVNNALQLDPDNMKCLQFRKLLKRSEALKEEGNDMFKNGQLQQAIDKYTEAINNDPQNNALNSALYCNRSACYGKLGKWDEAIADATKAIDLNPSYLKAYLRRAQCYQQVDKHEEAYRDYQKASDMDKDNRELRQKVKEAEKLYKKAKRKDYYKILDVSKDAETDAIKKAYKKAALKWHPDRFTDEEEKKQAEEKFKEIGEAHDVLTDSTKRQRYDSGVDLEDLDGGGGGFGFEHGDVSDIFRMFMGGGGGGGGMGGMRFSSGRGGGGGGGGHQFFF